MVTYIVTRIITVVTRSVKAQEIPKAQIDNSKSISVLTRTLWLCRTLKVGFLNIAKLLIHIAAFTDMHLDVEILFH